MAAFNAEVAAGGGGSSTGGASVYSLELCVFPESHLERTLVSIQSFHYLALHLWVTPKDKQIDEVRVMCQG